MVFGNGDSSMVNIGLHIMKIMMYNWVKIGKLSCLIKKELYNMLIKYQSKKEFLEGLETR